MERGEGGVEEKEIKEIIRKEREFYPMKSGADSQPGNQSGHQSQ